jgi:DNA polymerase
MPNEVNACRPHLDAIIALVRPKAIVLLGTPASIALGGMRGRITVNRGRWTDVESTWLGKKTCTKAIMTFHPSYVLRFGNVRTPEASRVRHDFLHDLKVAWDYARSSEERQREVVLT